MSPLQLDLLKSVSSDKAESSSLKTFTSYNFDRNIFIPASAFRFSAPGVDKTDRMKIRSGDTVSLYAVNSKNEKVTLATGFIDETDCHIIPANVDYVITGRDTIGQLVDNASIDENNVVIILQKANLKTFITTLLKNTRMPQSFIDQQLPQSNILFQTNPGETKINSLQRYLELSNCMIWSYPDGRAVVGKPNFSQPKSGYLAISSTVPFGNNCVEARVKRNVNQAVRKIVVQLQDLNLVDASSYTVFNNMADVVALSDAGVGRSVYETFSYGSGATSVNQIVVVGNQSGNNRNIGNEYAQRTIAKENVKVLDVEVVVEGHLNSQGQPFNIDQIYNVVIEDEDVNEDMYVYSCSYELTMEHGMLTRMHLCRLGTIVAYADAIARSK